MFCPLKKFGPSKLFAIQYFESPKNADPQKFITNKNVNPKKAFGLPKFDGPSL